MYYVTVLQEIVQLLPNKYISTCKACNKK